MKDLIMFSEQPLVRALGWSLLHFLWEGAFVGCLLAVALTALRGRSAQMRYGIACGALVLMTVLPLATFGGLALTSNGTPHSITASAGQRFALVGAPGGFGETDSVVEKITAKLDDVLPWVLVAWCVGVVLFLVRLNVGLMVARRIKLLATQRVPVELQEAFMELKAALGIARPVRLMHSALVQVPTVIGLLRPVVLIPVGCLAGMSQVQIEAIFAHELAHIRRHDYLVSVMQSLWRRCCFITRRCGGSQSKCAGNVRIAVTILQ